MQTDQPRDDILLFGFDNGGDGRHEKVCLQLIGQLFLGNQTPCLLIVAES